MRPSGLVKILGKGVLRVRLGGGGRSSKGHSNGHVGLPPTHHLPPKCCDNQSEEINRLSKYHRRVSSFSAAHSSTGQFSECFTVALREYNESRDVTGSGYC